MREGESMAGRSSSQGDVSVISKQARKYFEENRNVLVIEDDKIMGQMVAQILDDAGFEVVTAFNGRIAFEKLQQHPIDFIVLDVLLPEMNGFEIYSKLQAKPDTRDIPVLIITAWADEYHIEKASQLGIRHFLPKPFTEDELLNEIFSLLRDNPRKGA
jgi:chemosensory pili system protein ChpA (sensor histidine kinase/response regulator)